MRFQEYNKIFKLINKYKKANFMNLIKLKIL